MGSKERIQRLKEDTRTSILDAALTIVREEGWQSLSMRKIADRIEYTAPIIYEYFSNKEGILLELTRQGYIMLGKKVKATKDEYVRSDEQLEAMWIAYWNFAFEYKEFYQLMFGVDMICCDQKKSMPETEYLDNLFFDTIKDLMKAEQPEEGIICRKYYTFWSIIHGLISINMVNRGRDEEMNQHILKDALKGIIKYIND